MPFPERLGGRRVRVPGFSVEVYNVLGAGDGVHGEESCAGT